MQWFLTQQQLTDTISKVNRSKNEDNNLLIILGIFLIFEDSTLDYFVISEKVKSLNV